MVQIAIAFGLTAIAVAVLLGALRWKLPGWALLALALVPEILVYAASRDLRVISTHGFLHGSTVYRLMTVGVVPDCPVLAQEPLLYPWAHHLVVGWLAEALSVTPGVGFALLNVVALALTLFFAYRLGLFLSRDRTTATWAAAFAVFGVTMMNYRVVGKALYAILPLDAFLVRNPVVVKKFTNLNSNSLGYMFFSLFLYAAARVFTEQDGRRARLYWAELGIAVLGAALFYPIAWMTMGLCLVAMGLVALARNGTAAIPTLLRGAAVSGGASLLAAPYLYIIAAGKAQQMYLFAPDIAFLFQKVLAFALTLGPAALLLYWQRESVRRAIAVSGDAFYYVASVPAALFVVYVLIGTDWLTNEYKWLGMACFSMGILVSLAVAALHRQRIVLAAGIAFVFLLAFGADIGGKLQAHEFVKSDPYVEDGAWLRHADPAEDALYQWIASNTAADAVVLDDRLTVPTFARRSLYVGIDSRGVAEDLHVFDGWQIHPDVIMETYYAYPKELIDHRRDVARAIFTPPGEAIPASALDALREDLGSVGILVIARDPATAARFAREPRLARVFATSAASLYELTDAAP